MDVKGRLSRFLIITVATVAIMLLYNYAYLIVEPLHLQKTIDYILTNLVICLPIFIVLLLLHKPKDFFSQLGLDGNILTGMIFALISTLPLFIAFPIIGKFNNELTFEHFLRTDALAALFEEVIFRGFIFGQFFRYSKIGFAWAVLIPALLFGSLHLYQGNDLMSSLMAFGVTFIGGIYFSWIYWKWNFNLWCPIGLHFFMNLSWILFTVEGNTVAEGSVISNVFRIISIVVAIVITIVYSRRFKKPAM